VVHTSHILSETSSCPVYCPTCVRHAETLWKRTLSAVSWPSLKSLRNRYHRLILTGKTEYYANLCCQHGPRRCCLTAPSAAHQYVTFYSAFTCTVLRHIWQYTPVVMSRSFAALFYKDNGKNCYLLMLKIADVSVPMIAAFQKF